MSTTLAPTQIIEQPAREYHAHPAVSKGKLSDFRDSRMMYFHRHVACDAPEKGSSKRMDIGTLAHVALLEPERLDESYAIFPRDVLAKNGAESTNAAEAFRNEHEAAGRIVLKRDAFQVVEHMAASVRAKIGHWLKHSKRIEHSVFWTDPVTGLDCRCRPDWLIEAGGTAFNFDFKTTDSIANFQKVAENFDYWLQDAHYSDGLRLNLQCDVEFYFVVAQTEFPWPCALFELTPHDKHQAHIRRTIVMSELAECYQSGDWRDPWDRAEVMPLSLRPYVYQ